jgi:hypothetical protein
MRTNLMTGLLATAARRFRLNRAQSASVSVPFCAAMVAALALLPSQAARASEAARSLLASSVSSAGADCHRADEIRPVLFPKEQLVAYDFTGADASKLKNVMDIVTQAVAPAASLVRLVLLPDTDEAIAFQFGADGCHTATLDLNWSQMALVFESAGVHAPFGSTYYQTPGVAI